MDHAGARVLCRLAAGPVSAATVPDRLVRRLLTRSLVTRSAAGELSLHESLALDGPSLRRVLSARYRIRWFETVESTNAVGRSMSPLARQQRGLVGAVEQRGGRGRHDREWTSPPGGLWLSVVDDRPREPSTAWLDQLAMAVAVTDAVDTAGVDATLKWPNDVVGPTGGKLAGVLLEGQSRGDTVERSVCGVGINADVDPTALPPGATSLAEHLGAVQPVGLVAWLLARFETHRQDRQATLEAWQRRCSTLGEAVTVWLTDEVIEGVATSLEDDGSLVLDTGGDRRTIRPDACRRLRVR